MEARLFIKYSIRNKSLGEKLNGVACICVHSTWELEAGELGI